MLGIGWLKLVIQKYWWLYTFDHHIFNNLIPHPPGGAIVNMGRESDKDKIWCWDPKIIDHRLYKAMVLSHKPWLQANH